MQAKRVISFILLCVFSLYITPKEIYHAFVTHSDSEHTISHAKNHLEITAEHHHCELMKADQHFISSDILIPYYSFQKIVHSAKQKEFVTIQHFYSSYTDTGNPLRGPPAV